MRLAGFYEAVLGAPRFRDGARWIQFQPGPVGLAVCDRSEAAPGATGTTLILDVDDLDTAVQTALDAGAALLQHRDMGDHGRTAALRDPDGNVFQLFQKKGP